MFMDKWVCVEERCFLFFYRKN